MEKNTNNYKFTTQKTKIKQNKETTNKSKKEKHKT